MDTKEKRQILQLLDTLFEKEQLKKARLNGDHDMQTIIDDSRLKQLLKEAFIEALEEKKNIFHDLMIEAMEDVALVRAIKEGEGSETIDKQEVFSILDGNA